MKKRVMKKKNKNEKNISSGNLQSFSTTFVFD